MSMPRIEIYLDENSRFCIAKIENGSRQSKLILDIEVDELTSLSPEDAAHRVGGTVLNLVRLWNRDKFKDWEVLPRSPM